MRVLRSLRYLTTLVAVAAMAAPAAAQQGLLTGRVTDAASGLPVDAVQIQVLGGPQATGGLSDVSGVYRVQLPAGTYSVVVERVGYRSERFVGIRVPGGQTTTLDITLTSMALALDGVVITASRTAERQLESPATTHIVGSMEISERSVATPVDHLRSAPGVDIISSGIQSTNVVVRGFNNIFSGSLHALTDHRLAGVPSLRVNLLHFIPSNNEDIDRMEVVLGPGSALYGPNTASGVLHILTKSPLDHQGTTLSMAGGERSVLQGQFRTAHLLNDNFGFKVSGQYMQGNEWEYIDPVEAAARASAQASPATCVGALAIRGYTNASDAASYCARVGERDFDIKRFGVEARADYRFADDGTAVFTYGLTSGTGIELTGLGAGQTDDWRYSFYQARLNKGRFFGQAYYNASDAGGTFLLRDGVPLVDKSTLLVGQLRHGFMLGERQDFTYGVDYVATRPDTEETINGFYEDKDNMTEVGAYLQSKTSLSQKIDLILAGRVDKHNMLPEAVYSPRAALVLKPTEGQSMRFTYNRAFSTPSSLNFFLDISGGAAPNPLGSLGYTVRAFGTGKDGYSYQNADGSLKGVRSPFNPQGRDKLIPGSAPALWPLAVGAAAQIAAAQGTPLPASIVQLLASLQPSAAAIPLSILDPNTQKVSPLSATTIPSVPGIRESYTETFEAGWQGIISNRVRLSADVYYEKKNDFVSPLVVTTPLVLLDGQAVGAFITVPIVTALTQQFIAAGLPPAQAQQQAQAQAAVLVPQLATAIGSVPVGVVSSPEVAARGSDLIVTYLNVGDIDYWGADLGFSWFLNDRWTMNGTYSHVSEDYFNYGVDQSISLNAPRNKATFGLAYRNALTGFNAEGRVRYTGEFAAESAGYVGTKCIDGAPTSIFQEDCVSAATLFDVNLGYQIPRSRATVQLAVTNLFNAEYRSFVGVPNIGRFAMLRVKYDL